MDQKTTQLTAGIQRLTAQLAQLALFASQLNGVLAQGTPADGEIPTGAINGINAAFTLAYTPKTGSVHLFLNGVRQRLTTDYTVAGNTITYASGAKPQTGDNHYADYRH